MIKTGAGNGDSPLRQLKAISKTDQTIVLTSDGMVPVAEIVQESNRITVGGAGEITFLDAGLYRIQVQLNIDNTNNTSVETWAEYFNGATWEFLSDSGNVVERTSRTESNFLIESTFSVPSNFKIRLKARVALGSAFLDYKTLANGIGVPAITLIAYELR